MRNLKVLVVEEKVEDVGWAKLALAAHGNAVFSVESVVGPAQAMQRMGVEVFDVCLVEMNLGKTTGLKFIGGLADAEIAIPAILTTKKYDSSAEQSAIQGGAADYVVKENVNGALLLRAMQFAIARAANARPKPHAASPEESQDSRETTAESERRFRLMAESMPQLTWTATPDGLLDYVNTRWVEYCGLGIEKVRAGAGSSLLHPDEAKLCSDTWAAALKTGTAFECEYRMRRKDGVYRWQLARALPMFDENGVILKWFGSNTDIEEQKSTRDELQKNEAKFRRVFDSNMIGLFFWDIHGKIADANDAFLKTVGYTRQDLLAGRIDWRRMTPPEYEGTDAKVLEQVAALGVSEPCEKEYVRKDGSRVFVTLGASSLKGTDNITGIAFVIDNSDRKRIEEERSQLRISEQAAQHTTRLKSEFLANMSHEIRTPINGVMGMIGLLLDTELTDEQREFGETVKSSAEILLTLINDILDFSKIEAGKLDFEVVDFDLESLVGDLEKSMSLIASHKKIKLLKYVSPDLPGVYKGDPTRVKQVLLNLVNNAIKFTNQGRVTIEVTPESRSASDTTLRFEITDTGIGMSETDLGRLFKTFSQADSSTARKFGGTGLGLSICKSLVARMGGEIGVRSKEGVGSTFWFTITLPEGVLSNAPQAQRKIVSQMGKRPVRILIAEDNIVNQKIAVRMLEKVGCRVDVVANGKEAVQSAATIPYDLILMDCQMPEMDGYEASRRIIAAGRNGAPRIPIIAMTANAMSGDKEKCFAAGMNGYVSKPVKNEELIEAIERALSMQEDLRQAG